MLALTNEQQRGFLAYFKVETQIVEIFQEDFTNQKKPRWCYLYAVASDF